MSSHMILAKHAGISSSCRGFSVFLRDRLRFGSKEIGGAVSVSRTRQVCTYHDVFTVLITVVSFVVIFLDYFCFSASYKRFFQMGSSSMRVIMFERVFPCRCCYGVRQVFKFEPLQEK